MEARTRVVAMSGGVDSSVAAALLVEQGYDVIGLMMRLWSEPGKEAYNRCCTPDAMGHARHIAESLNIPFYVVDTKDVFHDTIVNFFIDGYTSGVTPNPCLECNRHIRWEFLLNKALSLGAEYLATGHPPLIIDLLPNNRDDDHMLALYKRDGYWGAVAKSNFVGLRYREPIFRTLRELVLSYFEQYYNVAGEKTLRSYTVPLNLGAFDQYNWLTDDAAMDRIADRLGEIRKVRLLTPRMVANLSQVDPRSLEAGLIGSVEAGLYKPPRKAASK